MKHCYLLPVFLVVSIILPAQTRTFTGKVMDIRNQEPIAGATVTFCGASARVSTHTDAAGLFSLEMPVQDSLIPYSQVMITALGYETLHPANSDYRYFYHEGPHSWVDFCPVEPNVEAESKWGLVPRAVPLTREVVITAHRAVENNFNSSGSVAQVSKYEWGTRPVRSVPEALGPETGVFLQKTNHGGGSPFIRGLTGQQTLLLMDGIRLNNATFRSGPNQYLNLIDPVSIQKMEVSRGGGSVQYGSDAIGGVVQTFSPDLYVPEGWHGQIDLQGATQNMEKTAALSTTWKKGRSALWLGGAYRNFGDIVGGKGIGKQSPTGYQQWSYNAKMLIPVNKTWDLRALWQSCEQEQVPVFHKIQLENFALNQMDPIRKQLGYVRLSPNETHHQRLLRKFNPTLTLSWQQLAEDRQSRKNNSPTTIYESDRDRTLGASLIMYTHPVNATWHFRYGLEFYADQVNSTKQNRTEGQPTVDLRGLYPDNAKMFSSNAFLTGRYNARRWFAEMGVRGVHQQIRLQDETLGRVWNGAPAVVGNLSLMYRLNSYWHVYTDANSAFRSPNIDDMGTLGIVDFRYEVPNADLRPEYARSAEAGVKFQRQMFAFTVAGYYTSLNGLISRIKTTDSIQGYPVYIKQNVASSYITGVESSLDWSFKPRWRIAVNQVYTYGQNMTTNEPMRRIPPLFGSANLHFLATQHLTARAEWRYAAAQRRLSKADIDDNRIADDGTPGWSIFNLHLLYDQQHWLVSVKAENLLNKAYRIHGSGIDGYGRSLWVRFGIKW